MSYAPIYVSRFSPAKQILNTTPARNCPAWSDAVIAERATFVKKVEAAAARRG
jgi:hypothetical protein